LRRRDVLIGNTLRRLRRFRDDRGGTIAPDLKAKVALAAVRGEQRYYPSSSTDKPIRLSSGKTSSLRERQAFSAMPPKPNRRLRPLIIKILHAKIGS